MIQKEGQKIGRHCTNMNTNTNTNTMQMRKITKMKKVNCEPGQQQGWVVGEAASQFHSV